jgi:hypothetical protein
MTPKWTSGGMLLVAVRYALHHASEFSPEMISLGEQHPIGATNRMSRTPEPFAQ